MKMVMPYRHPDRRPSWLAPAVEWLHRLLVRWLIGDIHK